MTRDDLPTAAFLLVPPRVDNRSGGSGAANHMRQVRMVGSDKQANSHCSALAKQQ